jgi:transcriptional regulator with XRE-family HTH domain
MDPVEMLAARKAGKTMRELAQEIGCSAPYVNDVLKRKRAPGPSILKYLGLTAVKTVVYKRANAART